MLLWLYETPTSDTQLDMVGVLFVRSNLFSFHLLYFIISPCFTLSSIIIHSPRKVAKNKSSTISMVAVYSYGIVFS